MMIGVSLLGTCRLKNVALRTLCEWGRFVTFVLNGHFVPGDVSCLALKFLHKLEYFFFFKEWRGSKAAPVRLFPGDPLPESHGFR